MKKETRKKLMDLYWIIIHVLALTGLLELIRYLTYGTFF